MEIGTWEWLQRTFMYCIINDWYKCLIYDSEIKCSSLNPLHEKVIYYLKIELLFNWNETRIVLTPYNISC